MHPSFLQEVLQTINTESFQQLIFAIALCSWTTHTAFNVPSITVFVDIFRDIAPINSPVEFWMVAAGCVLVVLLKLLIKWIITYISAAFLVMAMCAFTSSWDWMLFSISNFPIAYLFVEYFVSIRHLLVELCLLGLVVWLFLQRRTSLIDIEDDEEYWVLQHTINDIETPEAPSETEAYMMILKDRPNVGFDNEVD